MFLAFMVAPVFQVVNVGTQLTEAIAGLDRTSESLRKRKKMPSLTHRQPGPIDGDVKFEDVHFAYEPDKPSSTAFRFMPVRARSLLWWVLRDRANPPSSA